MAVLPDYVTGTITLANGSTTVTGTGTMFETAAFRPGDTLQIQNLTAVIASVDSNTSLTLTEPWTGTSLTNAPYRARYLPDGARVTAQTTTLIELLGNGVLSNIASVPIEEGKVLVGNVAGQYEAISKDELGIQDPNGSLDKLAALTLAANKFLRLDGDANLTQSDIFAVGVNLLSATTIAGQRLRIGEARPCFKAGVPVDVSVSNGDNTLNFSQVSLNVGNGWNGTIFTAPESGNYYFGCDMTLAGGAENTGSTFLRFYKNDGWYQEILKSKRSDFYHDVCLNTSVYLNAGDTFAPRLNLVSWAGNIVVSGGRASVYGGLVG